MFEWLKNLIPSKTVTYQNHPDEEEIAPMPPRPEVIPQSYVSEEGMKRPGIDLGNLDVSMYNPVPEQTDAEPWVGAGGDLRAGSELGLKYIAVPRVGENNTAPMYPMGSMVEVGGQLFNVRDLMGKLADGKPQWNTNRMDIFLPDETESGHQKALQFGRKSLPGRYFAPGEDPRPLN